MAIRTTEEKAEDRAAVRKAFWGSRPKGRGTAANARRIAWARRKYGTEHDRMMAAPTASQITAAKVKARREKKEAERKSVAADETRKQRMRQLAGMPEGRGMKELKRLAAGGSVKESAAEKQHRQRKTQLEQMPEGRGKKLASALETFTGSKKQETPTRTGAAATGQQSKAAGPKKQMVKNPYAGKKKKQTSEGK